MVDTVLNPTTPVTNGAIVSATNPLPVSVTGAVSATNITVGTTTVTGGATGQVLYDNAGVLGEMTNTGTGTVNVLQTAPAILTSLTLPSVAWASIPAPGTAGKIVRVSNAGTKGSLWMDDGTRWKPMNGSAVLATKDTPQTGITNTPEVLAFQYQIPAGLLQVGDRLRVTFTLSKSGTTDTLTLRFRMGAAGTTSDTQLYTQAAVLAAGNLGGSVFADFRLESATTLQQMGGSGGGALALGYSNLSSSSNLSPITITSAAANALFFSVGILSSSTTNTVGMTDATLTLISSAN